MKYKVGLKKKAHDDLNFPYDSREAAENEC